MARIDKPAAPADPQRLDSSGDESMFHWPFPSEVSWPQTVLLELLVKSTVLCVVGMFAAWWAERHSAALAHRLWVAILAGNVLLVPSTMLPSSWNVSVRVPAGWMMAAAGSRAEDQTREIDISQARARG
jgi:hypothetical protein